MNTLRCATVKLASLALVGVILVGARHADAWELGDPLEDHPNVVYGPIRNPENGHDYLLLGTDEFYGHFELMASEIGAYLVQVDDETEHTWLVYHFGPATGFTNALTGASCRYGEWEYYDGQPATYAPWCAGEPPTGGYPLSAPLTVMDFSNSNLGCWNPWPANELSKFAIAELEDCDGDNVGNDAQFGLSAVYKKDASTFERRDRALNFYWTRYQVSFDFFPDGFVPYPPAFISWDGFISVPESNMYVFYLNTTNQDMRVQQDDPASLKSMGRTTPVASAWLGAGVRYEFFLGVEYYTTVYMWIRENGQNVLDVPTSDGWIHPAPLSVRRQWPEYFIEQWGIRLEWSSPTMPRQVVPLRAFVRPEFEDCNNNSVSDECDILSGTSADCNGNGSPDDCELATNDCNANGIVDTCELTMCPSEWLFNPDTRHCYALTTQEGTWHQAEAEAVASGAHLVTINDENENTWVSDTFKAGLSHAWIGLHQLENQSAPDEGWVWISGEDVAYSYWYPPEPNDAGGGENGQQQYAWMNFGTDRQGSWGDVGEASAHGIMEARVLGDCNGNNRPDACDIDTGTSLDCDANGVPDECELDPPGVLTSSFDDDKKGADGWTTTVGDGPIAYKTSGGNPGGYLEFTDAASDPVLVAPPDRFNGNLFAYNGAVLSFDTRLIEPPSNSKAQQAFGTVTLKGAGTSVSLDLVSSTPSEQWTTWAAPLTAAKWGVAEQDWQNLLQNVTGITIDLDAYEEADEVIGFDNFRLSMLPDCDGNGNPDACEVKMFPERDCNQNGFLDTCEVAVTGDCNHDGILDECQIPVDQGGFCVENPDTPEEECFLHDCNVEGEWGFGIPDECEIPVSQGGLCDYEPYCPGTDCDLSGTLDICDIRRGIEQDCDYNSIPDYCDLRDGRLTDCNADGMPDDCQLAGWDCNENGVPDGCDIMDGTLKDCDMDGRPDLCVVEMTLDEISGKASRLLFARERAFGTTYQNMIAAYGRPWQFGVAQQSGLLPTDDPASKLRALFGLRTCVEDACIDTNGDGTCEIEKSALDNVGPVLPELFAFEMALGNEAFADAADRTIGLSGISGAELGDLFAFQGVEGISSLLDEELALLRGRDLCPNGECDPQEYLNDNAYYPVFTDAESKMTRAAIYNRLPPNAGGTAGSVAYISNYGPGINNNYDAAVRYPQGHGDAYGYYLKAAKVYLETFRGKPDDPADAESVLAQQLIDAQPTDFEQVTSGRVGLVDMPYQSVRNMARAMAARADTALRIVEKTYRRDYCEDPENPRALHMLKDSDDERAWGMADWARRGAMGAYLDWAVANQLLPASPTPQMPDWGERTDPPQPESWVDPLTGVCTDGVPVEQWAAREADGGFSLGPGNTCADLPADYPLVHRANVDEVFQLAGAVSEMQQRVDQAGAGLSPLGLLPNAVPFGINAGELGTASGGSHYEQVRDAAINALDNARAVLAYANQGNQRLREQGEAQQTFHDQVEDSEADFNNRLIELFGYPSPDDPADNDFDPTTTDPAEAESAPDLVNYLLDEQELNKQNFRPRLAPGEIQLAMAEVKLAGKRVEEAQTALKDLAAEIKDLQDFRRFLARKGEDAETIYDKYGVTLEDRETNTIGKVEDKVRGLRTAAAAMHITASGLLGFMGTYAGDWGDAGGEEPGAPSSEGKQNRKGAAIGGAIGAAGAALDATADTLSSEAGFMEENAEFQYEQEVEKLNVWKDVQLKQLDIDIQYQEQFLRLQSLVRQTPQFMLNAEIAKQNLAQAFGRLNAAVERGRRLVAERYRVQKLQRDQLQVYRWEDLAYRTFRNNALGKYDAFFDLAARYVMLAGRAYAYEYNNRAQADAILERIHRERMLGDPSGLTGGLQGIITDLDNLAVVNNFNTPLTTVGQRSFSLRGHMLGLRAGADGDASFRSFLERNIVQNLQEDPAMQDSAQLSVDVHYGPAIVVPFFSEVAGNNFFGCGPDTPFGNTNFPVSLNTKIRNFAIRLVGADCDALGIDPQNPYVSAFLMPIGQSILRENTNAATVEENLPRAWAVVDQWLPAPPLVSVDSSAVQDRSYNPWVSLAGSGGNYLNAVKRFRETEAEIELGQPLTLKTELAGRSVWNTQWLLVIAGGQWTSSSEPEVIRERLLTLIYGPMQQENAEGMTDIRIVIQAYAH